MRSNDTEFCDMVLTAGLHDPIDALICDRLIAGNPSGPIAPWTHTSTTKYLLRKARDSGERLYASSLFYAVRGDFPSREDMYHMAKRDPVESLLGLLNQIRKRNALRFTVPAVLPRTTASTDERRQARRALTTVDRYKYPLSHVTAFAAPGPFRQAFAGALEEQGRLRWYDDGTTSADVTAPELLLFTYCSPTQSTEEIHSVDACSRCFYLDPPQRNALGDRTWEEMLLPLVPLLLAAHAGASPAVVEQMAEGIL